MSDKRFYRLLFIASITIIVVAAIWKYPEVKTNESSDLRLGEYLYVDEYTNIHVSRKCQKLNFKGSKSKRIRLDDFFFYFKSTPIGDITFCPYCVSDKDYESVVSVFSEQLEKEVDKLINDNWL